ncbi:MAG: pyruvate kinase [Bacteroidales bacterium]|nr:pyruvate kinase [Bacteroidales bacterium]
MTKKTKIVATISDLKCDVDFIKELFEAGMNVVRLNTAHQTIEQTRKVIHNVRRVSDKIALLLDTKGPEIRTVPSEHKISVNLEDTLIVKGDPTGVSQGNTIYVSYNNFVNEIKVGDKILIDDGEMELLVISKSGDSLSCKATNSGIIKGKKSVNVPNVEFSLPAISNRDREYIDFAIEEDIDFIAHSFVRNKNDVLEIQNILDNKHSRVKIIAKIENQEGVDNIDEIIEHVYGIMVARGDLAIEIPYEKIPGIQKKIINKCIESRKPVIIATQMLHSMIENPRPTRAEVTDVANAIYSKTDAIMLSGETAYGKYPVESVQTMSRIAKEVEKSRGDIHKTPIVILSTRTSAYLTKSAVEASIKLDSKAIIADTTTGRTIRNMAGFRGKKPIYAWCYDKRIVRELALSFGIIPDYIKPNKTDKFIKESLSKLLKEKRLKKENFVVVLGGNFGRNVGASFIEISSVENLMEFDSK